MRASRSLRHAVLTTATVAAMLLASSSGAATSPALARTRPAADSLPYRVLVFDRTTGYRHASIPAGIAAIRLLGTEHGFSVDATTDPGVFTDARLAGYATVVFLSTTGDPVPTQGERMAFQRYIENGGGYVGIHAASDGGWDWPWYGALVGAYFSEHPALQPALVHIEDHQHPATAGLTDRYRLDEWYDFRTDPRGTVHILADVDDSTFTGSTMGMDHPITWCQDYDGGRSFYTAMGHPAAAYSDPYFLHIVLGGIETTAGVRAADCSPG